MTVGTQSNSATVLGNGAQKTFSYAFLLPNQAAASLYYVDAAGVASLLEASLWSLTGAGTEAGGTFTYPLGAGAAIAAGTALVLTRVSPFTQAASLGNQGSLYPAAIEGALDTLEMQIQDLHARLQRSVRYPSYEPAVGALPSKATRANKTLLFDVNGALTVGLPVGGVIGYVPTTYAQQIFNAVDGKAVMAALSQVPFDYITANIPQGPTVSVARLAVLNDVGTIGLIAGTRTSDGEASGAQGAIGIMGVAINDATGVKKQGSFAGYFEAQKKPGAGFTAALEVDTADHSGLATDINPYTFFVGDKSVGLWAAAGGARTPPALVNSSAAIAVLANGAQWQTGIVFQTGSLGTNLALSLAKNMAMQWWSSGAVATNFIQSTSDTGAYGLLFTDTATFLGNSIISTASFAAIHGVNLVNYVAAVGGTGGNPTQVQARGSDTSIDLGLVPKGVGRLILGGALSSSAAAGGASALPATPATYLTVRSNTDGLVYKIPLYN